MSATTHRLLLLLLLRLRLRLLLLLRLSPRSGCSSVTRCAAAAPSIAATTRPCAFFRSSNETARARIGRFVLALPLPEGRPTAEPCSSNDRARAPPRANRRSPWLARCFCIPAVKAADCNSFSPTRWCLVGDSTFLLMVGVKSDGDRTVLLRRGVVSPSFSSRGRLEKVGNRPAEPLCQASPAQQRRGEEHVPATRSRYTAHGMGRAANSEMQSSARQ